MSAWLSQRLSLSSWRRGVGVASAVDLLLVPFLGVTLFVRVLTDDASSANSHHSGGFNLSGMIAVLFMIAAGGLLLRRRRGMWPTVLALLWLCVWTMVAVGTNGASAETVREGVREVSVIALAVIVYNSREAVTISVATRLVQLLGIVPAFVAFYQILTQTGGTTSGELRAYGTFAHPNSAAMYFAIAAAASLWRYLDHGRRRSDAIFTALFVAALLSTYSIDGLVAMVAMLVTLGALRPGSVRVKIGPVAIAGAVALVFFVTPLGMQRVGNESATNIAAAERGERTSSLGWRFHKWKMLIPEWERSPIIGKGLGTTVTPQPIPGNDYIGEPPHNEYLRYLVETGVVGSITLLAALAIMIRRLNRKRRIPPKATPTYTSKAAVLALVIVTGCLVNSLADNTLLNSPTCYAAALLIASALSLPSPLATPRTTPVQVHL